MKPSLSAKFFAPIALFGAALLLITTSTAQSQSPVSKTKTAVPVSAEGQTSRAGASLMQRASALYTQNKFDQAAALWSQACNQNQARGCFEAGMYNAGYRGVAVNAPEARRLYVRGCELGSGVSCSSAAVALTQAASGPVDPIRARTFYDRACSLNETRSCDTLAHIYFNEDNLPDGVEKNYPAMVRLAEPACTNGARTSCELMGKAADFGLGRATDHAAARAFYARGCDLNLASSCNAFAQRLMSTRGGPHDRPQAVTVYNKSCMNLGDGEACKQLGSIFSGGYGMAEDKTKARANYKRACDLKNGEGCREYVTMMLMGLGGAADPIGALAFAERTCVNGQPSDLCGFIGRLIFDGSVGQPNPTRGAALLRAACAAGSSSSCRDMEMMGVSPSP